MDSLIDLLIDWSPRYVRLLSRPWSTPARLLYAHHFQALDNTKINTLFVTIPVRSIHSVVDKIRHLIRLIAIISVRSTRSLLDVWQFGSS